MKTFFNPHVTFPLPLVIQAKTTKDLLGRTVRADLFLPGVKICRFREERTVDRSSEVAIAKAPERINVLVNCKLSLFSRSIPRAIGNRG
jgi:hypothetical protein